MSWRLLSSTEPEQLLVLESLCRKVEGNVFVDIGCFIGGFTSVLGKEAKKRNGIVYAIDAFKNAVPPMDFWNLHRDNDIKGIFKKNMRSIGVLENIKIIEGLSSEVYVDFLDESIDLVFIDADHQYESVKKDIASWYPKIKTGGIICGHDYDKDTVQKAVYEKFLRINVDTAIWYYKKGTFNGL
jgi:predicted O-methyltransferase YrrM